jgi:hypothetical protein
MRCLCRGGSCGFVLGGGAARARADRSFGWRGLSGVALHEATVAQSLHRVESGDHPFVVGDHDDGGVVFLRDLLQQADDLEPALGVERGGRFVGEDDRRLVGESTRDGDSLLLAAGELIGRGPGGCGARPGRTRAEVQVVEQLQRAAPSLPVAI